MSYLNVFLILFSTLMSLGGAVNSGWSLFWPAIPFMGYLAYQGFKKGALKFILSILFVTGSITVSLTQDNNPLLYPILRQGEVTALRDGFIKKYSDGSGGFTTFENLTINKPTVSEKKLFEDFINNPLTTTLAYNDVHFIAENNTITLTKVRKGDVYEVLRVSHENGDFSDNIGVVTEKGPFISSNFLSGSNTYSVEVNKAIQSGWSKYLGNLMYWPVFPFAIITLFNK